MLSLCTILDPSIRFRKFAHVVADAAPRKLSAEETLQDGGLEVLHYELSMEFPDEETDAVGTGGLFLGCAGCTQRCMSQRC